MWKIIDTFEDFLCYWDNTRLRTIPEQISLWQTSYMAKYPELLEKQVQDYSGQGLDWRKIAEERIFPKIPEYLSPMREARDNLLKVCDVSYKKATSVLGVDFDVSFVIYVGLGCGAGWATQYEKSPACLFGLENIAECGWQSQEKLRGLTAHELSHLVHQTWRDEWDGFAKEARSNPLFQLYQEGFAQRCEHLILGSETWHEMEGETWLSWCQDHKSWLAGEYLRRIDRKLPVNDFFGSWLDIQGKKQTGYFLGHESVRWLEEKHSIRTIGTLSLEEIRNETRGYLSSLITP